MAPTLKRDAGWWLILCLGLALGAYELWPDNRATRDGEAPAEYLLAGGLEQLQSLTLERDGHLITLERSHQGWRFGTHQHVQTPATHGHTQHGEADHHDERSAGAVSDERLRMLAAARIERSFAFDPARVGDYGLDSAAAALSFRYRPGTAVDARFVLGGPTPDGFGRYLLDHRGARIVTLPAYQVDNLERLFEPTD